MKEKYFIKCEECGEKICHSSNIQKLFEVFFDRLACHNVIDKDICEEAKEELRFDDIRGAFAGERYQVYEAVDSEEQAVEWEEAGYGGLKE